MGSSRSAWSCRSPLSTYHAHIAKRADPSNLSERARRDLALRISIRRVFAENFQAPPYCRYENLAQKSESPER
jgi:hypothetical protein